MKLEIIENYKATLVLQSFGRENEYKRAILAIISFYAYASIDKKETKVILFTDKPEYFEDYLKGLPVHCVLLTPEKIKSMRGKIDFLHRMKIALIEEAFSISDGNIVYVDSDTFFIDDPMPFVQLLSEKKAFMHLIEYPFQADVEDKTETYHNFYKLINSKNFTLANGNQVTITSKHHSWNAGVMFFHPTHARLINDVYALTDQFFPASRSHASEQYAFSVVMQENTTLEACDAVAYHYWYRVKKAIVDQFLNENFTLDFAMQPLDGKLKVIKSWSKMLPSYFQKHELMVKDHAIQAFNKNDFSEGYRWAIKAFFQQPLKSGAFLKDTIFHLKRHLTHK